MIVIRLMCFWGLDVIRMFREVLFFILELGLCVVGWGGVRYGDGSYRELCLGLGGVFRVGVE